MKLSLSVLGSQSPFCNINNACPSYLITDGKTQILLDCGSGSHRFFDMKNIEGLNIFISHLHRDHYNDIFNYQYASYTLHNLGRINKKIDIYLPEIKSVVSQDIINEPNAYANYFEIEENKKYKIGGLSVEFLEVEHSPQVKTYAIKVCGLNKTVVYSADVSFKAKDKLAKFAKNADMFICETSFIKEHNAPEINSHITAYQASEIANLANVKQMMITHFWPEEDENKYLNEARQTFKNTILAKEQLIIEL